MQIDLNDKNALTVKSVKDLIASKDDTKNRQLRVSKRGVLYLSDQVGNENLADVKFQFETFLAGNGYTGLIASQDDAFVRRIFIAVKKNWESGYDGHVDDF